MTNPTTNFGWVMPSPTDLVTDLPADFEVFGQAVDTDFVDLLGGANGYILSKASATDLDFAWIPNDQGDITAVNVTAPITGGGTAGAVTIGVSAASTAAAGVVQLSDSTSTTSSVLASTPTATKSAYDLAAAAIAKSTVTTAGDIIYRNATVPVRLGIGTAGQVLRVNSGATAPEWATSSSSALVKVGTYTFTAAAALNVNNAFSATYQRYLLLVRAKAASGADYLYLKLRVGGVDSSTAYYYSLLESSYTGGANANVAVNNGTAGVSMVYADTSYVTGAVFNVFNPFEAVQTNYFKQSDSVGRGAANYSTSQGTGVHLANTSYDGFSLVSASGTYTGEVVVYGYAN